MGKISEALKKSASIEEKHNSPKMMKSKTHSSVADESSSADKIKGESPASNAGVGDLKERETICQLLPVSESLVACSADGDIQSRVAAEQFKMLRTQILFPSEGSPPRSIMVTSALPGEGKSFVSSNLAVSIALGRHEHVLLIEGDLRQPSLGPLFGLRVRKGLIDYLTETADLNSLLCKTPVDKLTLLPGGGSTSLSSELLSSRRMSDFLIEAKNRYSDRYIILDTTPAQVAAETAVLGQLIDGVILVVRCGRTSRKLVGETVKRIGEEKILGVVFNGVGEDNVNAQYRYQHYYTTTQGKPKKHRFFRRH